MSRKARSTAQGASFENGEAIAAQPRPAPKRKFTVKIGDMEAVKRCSVATMAETLNKTQGVTAILNLDGYDFEMVGHIPVGEPG